MLHSFHPADKAKCCETLLKLGSNPNALDGEGGREVVREIVRKIVREGRTGRVREVAKEGRREGREVVRKRRREGREGW